MADGNEGHNAGIYRVTHCAYKSEYVVASSGEEAREAAAGGFDHGEFVYGEIPAKGDSVAPVTELSNLQNVGETTVERLLDADSPVPFGPASETDALPPRDITRVRNRLSQRAAEHTLRGGSE